MRLPLTFIWVAGFANASVFRLMAHQLFFALAAGLCVVQMSNLTWIPVVDQAVTVLPEAAEIRGGRLIWSEDEPVRLAENAAFALVVDLKSTRTLGQTADVQVDWTQEGFRIGSLYGHSAIPYPATWNFPLNRATMEPKWGAYRSGVQMALCAAVCVWLLVVWTVFGFLNGLPIWWVGYFLDRSISLPRAWKCGMTTMLPGAILFSLFFLLYGTRHASLPTLLFVAAGHLIVGWIYALATPFWLEKLHDASRSKGDNPFGVPTPQPQPDKDSESE